jgi:ParB family transcriptional regulator, chromosome partitioning protein
VTNLAIQQTHLDFGTINPRELDAGDASDGWYTPAHLVAAAREVLGAIDTDPATCAAAQAVVQATTWYTEVENGLLQQWQGRLWLNPPYSAPSKWTDKALGHYASGDVIAALILTNSYTETGWWQRMAAVGVMLFFAGRMQFWHPQKESGQNRTGQTLCYLGSDRARFQEVFGHYGIIR